MTLAPQDDPDSFGGATPRAEALPVASRHESKHAAGADGVPAVIEVRLNPRRLWRWHVWLIEALARCHSRVFMRFMEGGPPLPRSLALLLSFERMVFRMPGEHACDLLQPSFFQAFLAPLGGADATPDIVLDLSGTSSPSVSRRVLRTSYDGLPDEDVLFAVLLAGALPSIEVSDASACGRTWMALPAVKDPQVLTRALDTVFSRQLSLCLKAVSSAEHGVSTEPISRPKHRSRPLIVFTTATLIERIRSRLQKLCRQGPRWFVGWRPVGQDRLHHTEALPSAGYNLLPDDGRRYYADPFLMEADGRLHLFCEEYDYALGRGIVSATTLSRDGTPGTLRPVLERPYHLSYPFVFAHAGQIWMIPESTAARTVELYRADPFPDRWVHAATLLSDIVAADATVFQDGDRWWMFAATVERQSSDWDALSLFYAPDLFGPWTPHPANPVLIDATAARPAGRVYHRNGKLHRPAQDCSTGYGGALALCAVDRLDPEGYAQTEQAVVRPGPGWPGRGLHTLNCAAGIEVVDGFGFPAQRRS